MQIFAYKCQGCSHHFDLLVQASTIPTCPECQEKIWKNNLLDMPWAALMAEWIFQVGQEAVAPVAIREAPGACSMN